MVGKGSVNHNKPKLKLNSGVTSSEQNEQSGYMQIFAGCMTGIRNPRAHDSDWEDTEDRALQLLMLANHLIERAQMAEITELAVFQGTRFYIYKLSNRFVGIYSINVRVQLHQPKSPKYLFHVPFTNGYWTNTYFFAGGFAVKCSL